MLRACLWQEKASSKIRSPRCWLDSAPAEVMLVERLRSGLLTFLFSSGVAMSSFCERPSWSVPCPKCSSCVTYTCSRDSVALSLSVPERERKRERETEMRRRTDSVCPDFLTVNHPDAGFDVAPNEPPPCC